MKTILFVGNSHTYFHDMPQMVRELAARAGEETAVTMLTHGGMTLDWHFHQEQTRFNLLYGGYDFCVLQQAAHPFPGYDALSAGVSAIRGLCGESPPRFVLYMTWAEKCRPENQPEMSAAYRRTAEEQGLLLAPVGEVWQAFRQQRPQWELYFEDGAHASPLGSFLAAACIARAIFPGSRPDPGRTAEGSLLSRLPASAREQLLDAAWAD